MFRKNAGTGCLGVDLNRNFPEGYGVGASKNPCDEVYKGKKTSIDFIPKRQSYMGTNPSLRFRNKTHAKLDLFY